MSWIQSESQYQIKMFWILYCKCEKLFWDCEPFEFCDFFTVLKPKKSLGHFININKQSQFLIIFYYNSHFLFSFFSWALGNWIISGSTKLFFWGVGKGGCIFYGHRQENFIINKFIFMLKLERENRIMVGAINFLCMYRISLSHFD